MPILSGVSELSAVSELFTFQDCSTADVPVVLVGNKADQSGDRMVTMEDGQRRSKEIGCVCFHEISVRESMDQVSEPKSVWH